MPSGEIWDNARTSLGTLCDYAREVRHWWSDRGWPWLKQSRLGRTWSWCEGHDLYEQEKGAHPTGSFIGLLGFLITQGLGLIVSEQGKDVRWSPLLVFLFIATSTVGAIVGILRMKKSKDSNRHAIDHGSAGFGRWIFRWSVTFVVVFFGAGVFNLLPGQKETLPQDLSVVEVRDYDWKIDKSKGLIAIIPLSGENYLGGLPIKLNMLIKLSDRTPKEWGVLRVDGFRMLEGRWTEMSPPPALLQSEDRRLKEVFLRELRENGSYSFHVYLHSDSASPVEPVKNLILKEGGIVASVKPPG